MVLCKLINPGYWCRKVLKLLFSFCVHVPCIVSPYPVFRVIHRSGVRYSHNQLPKVMTRTSTKRSYSYHPERHTGRIQTVRYFTPPALYSYCSLSIICPPPKIHPPPIFAASYSKGLFISRKYAHPTNQNNMYQHAE